MTSIKAQHYIQLFKMDTVLVITEENTGDTSIIIYVITILGQTTRNMADHNFTNKYLATSTSQRVCVSKRLIKNAYVLSTEQQIVCFHDWSKCDAGAIQSQKYINTPYDQLWIWQLHAYIIYVIQQRVNSNWKMFHNCNIDMILKL